MLSKRLIILFAYCTMALCLQAQPVTVSSYESMLETAATAADNGSKRLIKRVKTPICR